MTGFEVGKRYKTRDGEIVATLIAVGKNALVFETEDRVFVRDFDGLGACREWDDWDFLPIEVREPRKIEGFVWVNVGTFLIIY